MNIIPGSGNVYADLGFADPTAERLKSDLVIRIKDEIARRGLTQAATTRLLKLSQPDVSRLLRGRTGSYSLERLLQFTRVLGGDVEIVVRQKDPDQTGGLNLHVPARD